MAFASQMMLDVNCCLQRPSFSNNYDNFKAKLSSSCKPLLRDKQRLPHISVPKIFQHVSAKLLDAIVDSLFEVIDQPVDPSQSNFSPVDELQEAVLVTSIEGKIPDDFPEGVYARNGFSR